MKRILQEHCCIYEEMLHNIDSGVYFVDREKQLTFWNKGAESLTGFAAEDVVGKCCNDNILNHVDDSGKKLCTDGCPLTASLADGQPRRASAYLHHKEGHRVKVNIKVFPMSENGKVVGAIELFEAAEEDLAPHEKIIYESNHQYSDEELKMLALYDQLTGLPNRRYLDSILASRFQEYHSLGIPFGFLFMDIDKFRIINNNYGHHLGDKILQMVSKTLLSGVRKSDFVGRFGGEEFVGIFPMSNQHELEQIAEKLRMLVENSVLREQGGQEYRVTISIGGTVIRPEDSVASIIDRADAAMYLSKEKGRNRVSML